MFNQVSVKPLVISLVGAVLLIGIVLLSDSSDPSSPQVNFGSLTTPLEKNNAQDRSVVTTDGNRSYVPINISDSAAAKPKILLNVVSAFEKEHPELEITHWNPWARESSFNFPPFIYGVWIDHKPKLEKVPEKQL